MKIRNKLLLLEFEHDVVLGPEGSIKLTLIFNAFINQDSDSGEIRLDTDLIDVNNVKFLNSPIGDSYDSYTKFKENMKAIGIDVNELIKEEEKSIFTKKVINKLKSYYKEHVNG